MQFTDIQQKLMSIGNQRYLPFALMFFLALLIIYSLYLPIALVISGTRAVTPSAPPVISHVSLSDRLAKVHPFGNSQSLSNLPIATLGLILQGVFINPNPGQSQVLIAMTGQGAKYYKTGEVLSEGIRIYKILPDSVILSQAGNLVKLQMPIHPVELDKTAGSTLFLGDNTHD